jgi:hypothetical protein
MAKKLVVEIVGDASSFQKEIAGEAAAKYHRRKAA